MRSNFVFIDRRKGTDRRVDEDPSQQLDVDLAEGKRRNSRERRASARSILEDYYAYMKKQLGKAAYTEPAKKKRAK